MQVLNLLNKNNYTLTYKLGKELGIGIHGQIFNLVNYPNRVIKLSVCCDSCFQNFNLINDDGELNSIYTEINKNLTYVETYNPHIYSRVYKHDFILSGSRETINGNQDYIIYYYIMEKLQEISKDESKVFLEIFENSLEENIENILQKMRGALDFNKKNVMVFYTGVKNSKIKHLDLHVGNIMKDRKGNFKLIDLDLIEIGD